MVTQLRGGPFQMGGAVGEVHSKTYQDALAEVKGKRFKYGEGRTGTGLDASLCGRWVLIERDEVQDGEQGKVAVMRNDPDLQELDE